jgi:DNA-binding response OmpR family regulator
MKGRKMKVLLVDDEKDFVSTLSERLNMRGIDAEFVSSPEEAIAITDSKNFDIAVLDVKMPKIGGIKLKSLLQQKYPDMKFIFLTGHGSEDDYNKGSAGAGSEYYLTKPLNIEVLISKIKAITGE